MCGLLIMSIAQWRGHSCPSIRCMPVRNRPWVALPGGCRLHHHVLDSAVSPVRCCSVGIVAVREDDHSHRCRDETRLSTYEDLAVLCFGKRLSVIVDVSIILFCFGTCVAYIVAAYDIVSPIVRDIFPNHPVLFAKPTIMITVVTTIMFPLSLVDKVYCGCWAHLF